MISIAMCTYNGAKYIKEQLESILGQTRQPDEIVICDDGSTDGTIEIIKDTLAEWSGKLNVVENEINLGFRNNFQKAVGLCNGDIIFLCDQDDVWHKEKIAIMIDKMDDHPEMLLAVHDAVLVDENRHTLEHSFWEYFSPKFNPEDFENHDYNRLFMANVIQGCACAFRKELFLQALPFSEAAYHDEWLALVAAARDKLLLVKQPLLEYRQGNNQLGALRPSIMQRINKWCNNFRKSAVEWLSERERRQVLLKDFQERYGMELSELNIIALRKWLEFNNCRIKMVREFSLRLLFAVGTYFRMFSPRWAIKLWGKDLLMMFFGECVSKEKC